MKNLRNALHQIADLLADAIEQDDREERARKRAGKPRLPPRPAGETDEKTQAEARDFLERNGFKRTG